MPSNSRFFDKLGFLWPLAKLFMALGVIGMIATLLTRRQSILNWSAVSVGLGLALGFFREVFRPKVAVEEDQPDKKDR